MPSPACRSDLDEIAGEIGTGPQVGTARTKPAEAAPEPAARGIRTRERHGLRYVADADGFIDATPEHAPTLRRQGA